MGGAASARRRAFSLAPGDRIGSYVCVCPLAMGGMAELHVVAQEAEEASSSLAVVKRMLPHLAADPEFATMFLKEARLARGLEHPNITRLLEFGEDEGDFFIILEYVHGYDLRQLIREMAKAKTAVPLDVALGIAIDVCAGLHHAHEHRDASGRVLDLIHRDVTPSNVLLGLDGRVLLTDFGIARALTTMKTTRAGVIKGKLGYMSPEQCRDAHLDRRSDVFSVGVLLYEMTTGFRMFHAGNDFAVLNKIAKGEYVPPSEAVPDYPTALESIVAACVAVDAQERPNSAAEVQAQLEALVRERGLSCSSSARAEFVRTALGDKDAPFVDLAGLRASLDPPLVESSQPSKTRAPWGLLAAVLIGGVVGGAVVTASGGPDQVSEPEVAVPGPATQLPLKSTGAPGMSAAPPPDSAIALGTPEDEPTEDVATPIATKDPGLVADGVAASPAVPPTPRKKTKTRRKKPRGDGKEPTSKPGARSILPPSMRGK